MMLAIIKSPVLPCYLIHLSVLTTNCKLLDRTVPGIPCVQSCVNFFMHAVLICWDCSQMLELCPHC